MILLATVCMQDWEEGDRMKPQALCLPSLLALP